MTCINEMHENLGVESRESLRRDSNHTSSSSSVQNPNDWENATGSSSSSWEGSKRKPEPESSSSKVVPGSSGEDERENASGLKSSTPTEMFGVVDYIYST